MHPSLEPEARRVDFPSTLLIAKQVTTPLKSYKQHQVCVFWGVQMRTMHMQTLGNVPMTSECFKSLSIPCPDVHRGVLCATQIDTSTFIACRVHRQTHNTSKMSRQLNKHNLLSTKCIHIFSFMIYQGVNTCSLSFPVLRSKALTVPSLLPLTTQALSLSSRSAPTESVCPVNLNTNGRFTLTSNNLTYYVRGTIPHDKTIESSKSKGLTTSRVVKDEEAFTY